MQLARSQCTDPAASRRATVAAGRDRVKPASMEAGASRARLATIFAFVETHNVDVVSFEKQAYAQIKRIFSTKHVSAKSILIKI